MRHEPAIDRAGLLGAVRGRYGLAVEGLAFVPVGYAAACYVPHGAGGARWFLKAWPTTADGGPHPAWREGSLRLARALHERDLGLRVPYPLLARDGALWATLDGMPLAVFPFLAGASPTAGTPALRDELARTIATMHRATPALADVLPPREAFAIVFAATLRRDLARLDAIGPGARAGLRALRDWLIPRRAEVLAQLARLEGLRAVVRGLRGPLVLCHTDIGDDNLLVDDAGRLAVLDWDEATLAPPEYDLYSACEEAGFGRFLATYAAAGGAGPLHLDHFAFVLLRRQLGDMAVRLRDTLDGPDRPDADAAALAEMDRWGFARWRALDATLATIAAALGGAWPDGRG